MDTTTDNAAEANAAHAAEAAHAADRHITRHEARHETRLAFDGKAADYWRLWTVHMLLNILTLGLYSPWAKVRKARWFAQHTLLLGDRFDYHGVPLRILAGRLVGLALLVVWSVGFDFSPWAGILIVGLLCAVGPLLFANAQRFRMANSDWRGLRFGFAVKPRELYLVCVPPVLLWTGAAVLQAFEVGDDLLMGFFPLMFLAVPWMHARLKWMQHARATFCGEPFRYTASSWAFYKVYLKGFGLLALGFGLSVALTMGTHLLAKQRASQTLLYVIGFGTVLAIWLVAWPLFVTRLQQVIWSRTRWKAKEFKADMKARSLAKVAVIGGLLTLLTAGLYWPFLAVAIARRRVEAISVVSDTPFDALHLQAARADSASAVGDGTMDLFDLDLGW